MPETTPGDQRLIDEAKYQRDIEILEHLRGDRNDYHEAFSVESSQYSEDTYRIGLTGQVIDIVNLESQYKRNPTPELLDTIVCKKAAYFDVLVEDALAYAERVMGYETYFQPRNAELNS